MSFNKFSEAQTASKSGKLSDKTKTAPAGVESAAQPIKKQDEATTPAQ